MYLILKDKQNKLTDHKKTVNINLTLHSAFTHLQVVQQQFNVLIWTSLILQNDQIY